MRSSKVIHVVSCHAEGEVGDVIGVAQVAAVQLGRGQVAGRQPGGGEVGPRQIHPAERLP